VSTETDQDRPGHAGVLETLRSMPRYTRFALLGVFVNQFGAFLQAFLVLYLLHRGFPETDAGIALGGYALGGIAGTIGGGWLTDRLGSRLTIATAVAGASVMTLSVTVLPTIESIVVAVFLAGTLTLVARPAVTTLLLRSVPESRQVMVQAMYRTALHTGGAAGPMVAALLSTVNWNLVFYVDASAALLYGLIALFLFPRRDQEQTAAPAAGSASGPAPRGGYLTVLRDRRFVGYLLIMFVNGVIYIQLYAVVPLMVAGAGLPTWVYGATITASAVLVIGAELLVTKVTQRWPLWVAVSGGWVLFVAGRGGFGLFDLVSPDALTLVLVVLVGASVLATAGQVIGGPAAFAYPARVAPPGAIGRYIGSMFSSFQLGQALGPVIGAAVWLRIGGGFWVIILVAGLLLTGLLVWAMRPPAGPPPTVRPRRPYPGRHAAADVPAVPADPAGGPGRRGGAEPPATGAGRLRPAGRPRWLHLPAPRRPGAGPDRGAGPG
jgi:MFS family permease